MTNLARNANVTQGLNLYGQIKGQTPIFTRNTTLENEESYNERVFCKLSLTKSSRSMRYKQYVEIN